MKLLKDIVLALVNATVLLLVILVIAGIVLMGRVDHLAEQVDDIIAPEAERLERIATSVESIDAQLADTQDGDLVGLRDEIEGLRAELAVLTETLDDLGNITAQGLAARIGEVIAQVAAKPGQTAAP